MTNREIAAHLAEKCSRRLSGHEIALCSYVEHGEELHETDRRWFESLKTQFASELAHAEEAPAGRETPDEEGAGLL